eukprot:814331-Rhodomonas_salina.1
MSPGPKTMNAEKPGTMNPGNFGRTVPRKYPEPPRHEPWSRNHEPCSRNHDPWAQSAFTVCVHPEPVSGGPVRGSRNFWRGLMARGCALMARAGVHCRLERRVQPPPPLLSTTLP